MLLCELSRGREQVHKGGKDGGESLFLVAHRAVCIK